MELARPAHRLSMEPLMSEVAEKCHVDGLISQLVDNVSHLLWDKLKHSTMLVQQDNLKTLIDLWPSIKDCQEQNTLWGDEIEYVLLKLDHSRRHVDVAPQGSKVIEALQKDKSENAIDIQREAYEYMVETSPLKPYTGDLQTLATVEQNMQYRRQAIQNQLDGTTAVFSLSRFGMFGAQDPSTPDGAVTPEAIKEEADALVTKGSRYMPILKAIEKRRGHAMKGEAFIYDNTKSMSSSSSSLSSTSTDSVNSSGKDSITIDNPIYAIGGCAVQVNFGMTDLSQAFQVHDQFCPIGPLMLALTAASPILKGYLVETDARWDHCTMACDDRNSDESHLAPRWSKSPMYFEDLPDVQALNHALPSMHGNGDGFSKELQQAGMPVPMANYFGHALDRDPMMHPKAASGTTEDGDLNDRITRLKTHLSAIWPHIRMKLADPENGVPWLVEFRSMETQPSDFEIAAVTVFLKLLQQTILHFQLELRIPMHMVEENMSRAQVADAVEEQKFWFNISNSLPNSNNATTDSNQVRELSLNEIFNGLSNNTTGNKAFPGLLHYVREFLATKVDETDLPEEDTQKLQSYLDLISQRASGVEPTPAKWMRSFVLDHPDYNGDSQVTQEMYYEMMCKIAERSQVRC